MKRLLNAALIAALGFWVGACTIVTDPSSGSNATTGGSDKSGFLDRQQQIAEFASVNLDPPASTWIACGTTWRLAKANILFHWPRC